MSDIDPLEPPKQDIWDYLHKATKVALTVCPPARILYEIAIAPPFQLRTIEWMNMVAIKLKKQDEKFNELKPENLANNEVFQSAFAASARIAVQTHQKEKLEALCNALLNTVIMKNLDENFKLLFFNYIDDMTVLHMDVVKFFRERKEGRGKLDELYTTYFQQYQISCQPNIEIDDLLFTAITKDLENKGLLRHEKKKLTGGGAQKSAPGQFDWIAHTDLGEKFYKFIIEPKVEKN